MIFFFYKPKFDDGKMKIDKQLVFKSNFEICVYVFQLTIKIEKLSKTLKYPIRSNISQAIKTLDLYTTCIGDPRSIDIPGKHYFNPYFL